MTIWMIAHLILCLALIGIILVQKGQASMGTLGAGGSHSLFGAKGSTHFLIKITAILATLFFISSIGISIHMKPRVEASVPVKLQPDEAIAPAQQPKQQH